MNKFKEIFRKNKGYILTSLFVCLTSPLIYLMQNKTTIPFDIFLISVPVIFASTFIIAIPFHFLTRNKLNSKELQPEFEVPLRGDAHALRRPG